MNVIYYSMAIIDIQWWIGHWGTAVDLPVIQFRIEKIADFFAVAVVEKKC